MLRKALAAATASMLLLAVPVATAAEPAPKGIAGAFELQGTNGYGLMGLIGSTGKVGVLTLFVGKKGREATYFARGEVTKEGARFDLGKLGEVDFTTQPTGQMETVHPSCGKPVTVEGEEYVGTFEFHGEEGFTEATATSTPLRLKPILDIVCPGFSVSQTSGGLGRGVRLDVHRKKGPSLELERNHEGARVFYEARVSETSGTAKVERSVSGHLASGSLEVDQSLSKATFAAGSPFAGKGTYVGVHPPNLVRAKPGKGTWRGSLKVDFPGRAGVRLAGPGFSASIIHATRQESRF